MRSAQTSRIRNFIGGKSENNSAYFPSDALLASSFLKLFIIKEEGDIIKGEGDITKGEGDITKGEEDKRTTI